MTSLGDQAIRLRARLARLVPADRPGGAALRRAVVTLQDLARFLVRLVRLPVDALFLWTSWRAAPHRIGSHAAGRSIVMLVVSSLRSDPRVRREAHELASAGYSVTVIWPDGDAPAGEPIDWGPGIAFEPLDESAGRFAYGFPGFLGWSLVKAGRNHRPLAFHAHDLNTMLAALVLGRETGAHVVADHHEWFSEHVTWSSRRNDYRPQSRLSRSLNRWLEGLIQYHASRVITVGEAIAKEMQTTHGGVAVEVIRNIPSICEVKTDPARNLRRALGIKDDRLLILYQGGVGPSRALEPVIAALGQAPEAELVIRGPGIDYYRRQYEAAAKAAGAQGRLHLLPPVPQEEVVRSAFGADCGLYTVAGLCKSFTYALPNKVFEYLAAGLPVLTANYPEVHRLVVENGAGLAFDPSDPADIARAMRQIGDPELRRKLAAAAPAILTANPPDAEWRKLRDLYDALPRTGPSA